MNVSMEELQLATRNHGMPLEAMRHDITPVGLHYLLVHYDVPVIDPASWRLAVGSHTFTMDELLQREQVTLPVTMECAGNGRALLDPRPLSQPWLREAVGTAAWTGTPLRPLLEEAGLLDGPAKEIVFTGADRGVEGGVDQFYERALAVEVCRHDDLLLAWGMNGAPLPPQHGFPLRLVVPGWYGMTSVKWLVGIRGVEEPFTGYQNAVAYRYRFSSDDQGWPVTKIAPRVLMVPPGVPDFYTRRRYVDAGRVVLEGRVWSGMSQVEIVEVSTNGGRLWGGAPMDPPIGKYAWRRWTYEWDAEPGETTLCCRTPGQPYEAPWNVGGYAVNHPHRIEVTVR